MKKNQPILAVLAIGLFACNAGGTVSSPDIAGTDDAVTDEALSARDCPTGVPAALVPPADQLLAFKLHATGYQVYVCSPNPAGAFSWVAVNPVANLYRPGDDDLKGTHFIGPTWQGNDGSNVVAAKVAAANAPDGSIPWLLLKATSNLGPGRFANTTYIQRLSTSAGQPTGTCDATTSGTIQKSAYSTDYFYYQQNTPRPGRTNLQCNK